MTTGTKTIKQKLFFSTMILAFMWVVVGDLISIHLDVIFDEQVDSNWHHPFAKTHKDDGKTYKVKSHKIDSASKSNHFAFVGNKYSELIKVSSTFNYYQNYCNLLSFQKYNIPLLRGPPSLV
ncbi:MAG: hypothetical protein KAG64_05900 [Bacteroidales bacterium]|nr:hypothetical protein [Bacteroidales bacterium]